MRLITESRVELIGKPIMEIDGIMAFLDEHDYEWPELSKELDSMSSLGDSDSEWITEFAGRMCYQSWPKKDGTIRGRSHADHIKHLIEVKHGACIEHATFNFAIWGVSRSLTHELVRHRLASYSQLSQRYVDSSDVGIVVPPAIQELKETDIDAYNMWVENCRMAIVAYDDLTKKLTEMYKDIDSGLERRKKARQAARSVLPNATETKIVVTMNARALRHLVELRANPAADVEIRALAVKICRIIQDKAPLFAHGLNIEKLDDNTEGVTSAYPRV